MLEMIYFSAVKLSKTDVNDVVLVCGVTAILTRFLNGLETVLYNVTALLFIIASGETILVAKFILKNRKTSFRII